MTIGFLAIGFAAGILSGLFGIGGGILIVPALIIIMRFPSARAMGTSLGALVPPVAFLAAREYWRAGHIDIRGAILLAIGITIGGWVSARFGQNLAPAGVQRAFAVFLVVVAVRLWVRAG